MLSYFNKSSADVVNKFEIGSFRGYSAPLEEKYVQRHSIPNNLYAWLYRWSLSYRVLQHVRELKEVKYVEVDQVSVVLSANKMTLIV